MQELQIFEFYYTLTENSTKKYIVETKLCRAPEQTKIYKSLLLDLNSLFIHSFGYQVKTETLCNQ